ncbi:MAG: methionyl-tRNA formyltransferase [Chitinophagaceae bacterium]
MDYKNLRIVFLGTPEFAKGILQKLHESGCNIVGVITAPDKPAGRGMKLQQSAVKQYAMEQGLHILQPEKLKNTVFLDSLKSLNADIQIVVAFRMLPEVVWNMPPMGTINLHASLLPQYRGAAPINWAIINGETKTGLTTFKLQHEIDTGNILLQKEMEIDPDENAGQLHDEMKELGADLMLETIIGIANGTLHEIPQNILDQEQIKHAPKIFTETCRIEWNKSVKEIYNLIRGLSPFPTAFTLIQEKNFKIFSATYMECDTHVDPGTLKIEKNQLSISCKNGFIYPIVVQAEGKKKMNIDEYLRGARL